MAGSSSRLTLSVFQPRRGDKSWRLSSLTFGSAGRQEEKNDPSNKFKKKNRYQEGDHFHKATERCVRCIRFPQVKEENGARGDSCWSCSAQACFQLRSAAASVRYASTKKTKNEPTFRIGATAIPVRNGEAGEGG